MLEDNWEKYKKEYSNPYELIKRNKVKVKNAMEDIELLAKTLPEQDQKEIFDNNLIENMISAFIPNGKDLLAHVSQTGRFKLYPIIKDRNTIDYLDKRRTQIASKIMKPSINFILNQVKILFEDNPSITELIESQLHQSNRICEDIANKIEIMELKEKEKQEHLKYLFNWNKIPGPDDNKLRFIYNLESLQDIELYTDVVNISKSKNKSTIFFKIVPDIEFKESDHDEITVEIKINENKNYQKNENKDGSILIRYSDDKKIEIPVEIQEDVGMKYVFINKSYLRKTIKK